MVQQGNFGFWDEWMMSSFFHRAKNPSISDRAEMELIHGIQHAMLTYHQDKLQLWLNLSDETGLETVENEVRKVLANQHYAIRCKISVHPNLSMESGELTPKGTISADVSCKAFP